MSFDLDNAKLQVRNFIEKYPINEYLVKASEKTKVEKEIIFVVALAVLFLLVFFITGGDVIIDIIGFAYPFYMSLKAIETEATDDDKQWLTYWIVFVLFKLVENIADVLVSFIPFYFFFKVGFLVWACHPSFKGATLVYDLVFKSYIVPALGITVKSILSKKQSSVKQDTVPFLEVFIDKLVRNYAIPVDDEGSEGLYVEVAVLPPPGITRIAGARGLEGTYFKTQVALAQDNISFQHRVIISPLPESDGFMQVTVKQKHTYGDDVVVGERDDLLVSSFLQQTQAESTDRAADLVVSVGPYDITLSAKYVGA